MPSLRWFTVAGALFLSQTAYTACDVALIPGAFGAGSSSLFLSFSDYFSEAKTFFEAKGCRVLLVRYPDDAKIVERAMMLRDQWEKHLRGYSGGGSDGSTRIWIAHSLGGLDARYALKNFTFAKPKFLATIGVPHSGANLANWVKAQRDRRSWSYYLLRVVGSYDLDALRFLEEVTPEVIAAQKIKISAVPGIRYASAIADCRGECAWPFRVLAWWRGQSAAERRGDGIVASDEQKWGEDLGTFDLDHITSVGSDVEHREIRRSFFEKIWTWQRK